MTQSLTALVAAAALPLASLVLAAPANAAVETVKDRRGDVQAASFDVEDPEAPPALSPARAKADPDLVRVVNTHSASRVVVAVRLRRLRLPEHMVVITVRTNRSRSFDVAATIGTVMPTEVTVSATGARREPTCRGATVTMNRRARTITTSVPRSCLGNPRWVRVGAAVLGFDRDMEMWVDSLHGTLATDPEQPLPVGRRLRRG